MKTRIMESRFGLWWGDATLKQRLVLIISTIAIVTTIGYSAYALVRTNQPEYRAEREETKQDVNIKDISKDTKALMNKGITVMTTTKIVDPQTYSVDPNATTAESNVTSTPTESVQGKDYYVSGGNGGRYEYEQVDPAIENPVQESTAVDSGGGGFEWDMDAIEDASDGALNPWDDGNWQFEDNSTNQ